jgi:hypothetical protein
MAQRHNADTLDTFYRENLAHGADISLLEHYYELLSRPVESIDQLKKLVYISGKIKELEIPLDPEEELKNKALKTLRGHPFDRYMKDNAHRFATRNRRARDLMPLKPRPCPTRLRTLNKHPRHPLDERSVRPEQQRRKLIKYTPAKH